MASKARTANVLKADLVAAQVAVEELLESVILDRQTRIIENEGRPAAVIMPYAKYLDYEAGYDEVRAQS